ncbi:cytosolic iron-sulfur protein assembly protein 1 [Paraphaeosphaeria sporulosa]|uniref:Probable cytosolic iron-sulfur protein assembly protein 1 n=1 Tax=Paraphaeosphaeria sporulosa TaxID=1460663 RepID=A0A177CLB4_9PLEO|nr:cytosolic iron-sulfur protein assembly protein 1 [Paraphaeosphaeria sporulosa]OAG07658.1 cytosolic iron-sulfur protein assembly protein 1 [Paraphaeosphaeria sporulosa]
MAPPPPAPAPRHAPTHTLRALATLTPPSNSRTWQTAPHPSQPIVATACSDRSVRIYSLTSFTLLHSVTGGHKRSVRSVSWKPHVRGQDVLATGSFDASAGIWRHAQHRLEREITSSTGVEDDDEDDDDEYQFACILDGHESEIKSLSWSPSGQYLATCSRDKSVWIWEELEEDNFETVAVLQEHDGDVKCVAWHPEEDLLVSASYDDTVRLYREDADDWVQVACITGHTKTVWWAEFEGSGMAKRDFRAKRLASAQQEQDRFVEELEKSGPRLATCSDDISIRIWRRKAREGGHSANGGMPSIIRSAAVDEDWYEDAVLPQAHERAVYSVSWSRRTGMIVSAGSDGKIIVYKERWKVASGSQTEANGDTVVPDADAPLTEWVVVAELFSAHDVFEINHVVWAERADKGKREGEEVILSTGDDGEVRVWVLEEQGEKGEKEEEGAAPQV